MKLSLSWLKKYVHLPDDLTPEFIAREISRCVAEVESFTREGEALDNIVVGKIIKLKKHPQADNLQLAQVGVSDKEIYQVVCGGSNLKKNMLVALAKVGAKVRWHGQGDLITLKKTVIRGEESEGMICASAEIGLDQKFAAQEEREILDLTALNLEVGQSLKQALKLDDVIFEVDNKTLSKRPDLFSIYGFARELSVIFDLPLQTAGLADFTPGTEEVKVTVDDFSACPRYMGIKIDNITVGPSPDWLQKALDAVGVRSVNNIVDITNYILFDLGQPLHAFDAEKIKEGLSVRFANKAEKLALLDGTNLKLDETALVIADAQDPLALAGIMGGVSSEITSATKSIFLECANFQAGIIRRMSLKYGLRTESSTRFEKALDPVLGEVALHKAVNLILQLVPQAKVISKIIDLKDHLPSKTEIILSKNKITEFLGQEFSPSFIIKTLRKLGFEVAEEDSLFTIGVPSWRATRDIKIDQDVLEEILRIYGYDNVPSQVAFSPLRVPLKNKFKSCERQVLGLCSQGLQMQEIYNYSFISYELLQKLNIDKSDLWQLENPLAQNIPLLKNSLTPHLMQAAANNLKFYKNFSLFELSRVFLPQESDVLTFAASKEKLPWQPYYLAAVVTDEDDPTPFYTAKKAVSYILEKFCVNYKIEPFDHDVALPYMHPVRSAKIMVLNEILGYVFEPHPVAAKNLDIEAHLGLFELNFDLLVNYANDSGSYKPVSKFPKICLDLSLTVGKEVLWGNIKEKIKAVNKKLIKEVVLFDVFQDETLRSQNKKSIAFTITYQSDEKTLEQEQAQKIHDKILALLERDFHGQIRQ